MGPNLIIAVGLIYLYIAVESFCTGKMGLSIVFAGYAFSNIGLYMGAR